MKRLHCRLVGRGPGGFLPWAERHRESCLFCQAAASRERAQRRSLRALADVEVPAPATLGPAVLSRLGRQDSLDPRRELVARAAARYAAAAGMAAAALATLVSVMARRHSRALG